MVVPNQGIAQYFAFSDVTEIETGAALGSADLYFCGGVDGASWPLRSLLRLLAKAWTSIGTAISKSELVGEWSIERIRHADSPDMPVSTGKRRAVHVSGMSHAHSGSLAKKKLRGKAGPKVPPKEVETLTRVLFPCATECYSDGPLDSEARSEPVAIEWARKLGSHLLHLRTAAATKPSAGASGDAVSSDAIHCRRRDIGLELQSCFEIACKSIATTGWD